MVLLVMQEELMVHITDNMDYMDYLVNITDSQLLYKDNIEILMLHGSKQGMQILV